MVEPPPRAPGDDHQDFADLPGAADGYWPGMAIANVLDMFTNDNPIWPDLVDEVGAHGVLTVNNSEDLQIPPDCQSDLLADLARHGITATLDDAFIAPFELPG